MVPTVQSVFDIAIHLMDAQNEATGGTDTADTREYRLRTPSLINSLLDKLYPLSDTYAPGEGRGVCRKVAAMTDEIGLDEGLCTAVLPYGLAALLLAGEDSALAAFFQQVFLSECERFGARRCGSFEEVEDVYGGIGKGEFGRW